MQDIGGVGSEIAPSQEDSRVRATTFLPVDLSDGFSR